MDVYFYLHIYLDICITSFLNDFLRISRSEFPPHRRIAASPAQVAKSSACRSQHLAAFLNGRYWGFD